MFGWFNRRTEEDEKRMVAELRGTVGGSEKFSDLKLRRFLDAHQFDAAVAEEKLRAHIRWVGEQEGRTPSAEATAVLETGRFRYLGLTRDGLPVIVYNFMWGQFLECKGGVDAVLEATIFFLRDVNAKVQAELGADAEPQWIVLNIGGPPPYAYSKDLSQVLTDNFPEHLKKAVLYPVPFFWRVLVNFMIAWLPTRTQEKFCVCGEPDDLLEQLNMAPGSVPDDILHIERPSDEVINAATRLGVENDTEYETIMAEMDGDDHTMGKNPFI